MKYRQLKEQLNKMDDDRLMDDVTIAIIDSMGVEVTTVCDFVDPHRINEEDKDYCQSVYLDDINDSILDDGHVYMTIII